MKPRLVTTEGPAPFNLFADAPTPWRAIRSYSEISMIVDANGHSLLPCPKELAGRIVAAVNLVECVHHKQNPRGE